jgi:hypothetical protein
MRYLVKALFGKSDTHATELDSFMRASTASRQSGAAPSRAGLLPERQPGAQALRKCFESLSP